MSIYIKLIWSDLMIGLFGLGGGYAMLSLIQREIVGNGWLTFSQFTDIVAISQMTPGPRGINSATYIGYSVAGSVLGSIIVTLAVVIPPYILVMYASHYIRRHKDSAIIKGVFMGLRPVVVGLIASAALLLMNGENFGTTPSHLVKSICLCVGTLFMVMNTKIHPIFMIVVAAIVGLVVF